MRVATHLGYELLVGRNASEGLQLLNEYPDIILVDIGLPDLDGLALVREIRKTCPEMPIIAVTASTMPDDKRKCLEAGCSAYIAKPFGWSTMLDLLRAYEVQILRN